MRGYQTAVCVHADTQSSCFGSDEAVFALQTKIECRAAEAELVLVRLRCAEKIRAVEPRECREALHGPAQSSRG